MLNAKLSEAEIAADVAAAKASRAASESARDKAEEWAETPEDTEVDAGKYSAKHHAEKANKDATAALASAASAIAAKTDAETARDAAFGNADVYADEPTGRAAVADGEQFSVVDGIYLVRYERVDAGTSAEVARIPNSEAIREKTTSTGELLGEPDHSLFAQVFNGATLSGDTVTIPSGFSGNTTYVQARLATGGWAAVGRVIRHRIVLAVSPGFSRSLTYYFQITTASGNATRAATVTVDDLGTQIVYDAIYTLQGDETQLRPFLQIQGSAVTTSDETMEITSVNMFFDDAASVTESAVDVGVSERIRRARRPIEKAQAMASTPALAADQTVHAALSGGDYTSPGGAMNAIEGAAINNRYTILVAPGEYGSLQLSDKGFIDILGASNKESWLKFHQGNNVDPALMASESAILMRRNTRIEGMKITAKNARYVVHLESDGNFPNELQEIVNCYLEHLGNDDGVGNYWGAQYAIGCGVSSGQVVRIADSTLVSKRRGGFAYHTNVDFDAPSRVELIRSRLIAHQAGINSFELKPLGSLQNDVCFAEGCVFGGDIAVKVDPWLQTDLAKQPADHCEITLTGHGNSPAVFKNEDWGEALRIDSATSGASSSVEISGDAVALIFGDGANDRYFARAGSDGFSAAVWGWGDISIQSVGLNKDVLNKTLGLRLGDCTMAEKTLTVTVDGGAPITVSFNVDYTSWDNEDVIYAINLALGSAAAASIFMPGARKRPMFADEETAPKNTSGSAIVMGMVLAYDNSVDAVRPMTSADDASLFAGVAWEDIESNERGRVKSRGYLALTDILRTDGAAVSFGDTFSIDAGTPGSITLGGAQGLLPAIRNDAVRVA